MTRNAQNLWSACLGHLQLSVPRPSFETWLKGTTGLSFDGSSLVVGVPTTFASEWLERRMLPLVQRAAAEIAGSTVHVTFQVAPPNQGERGTERSYSVGLVPDITDDNPSFSNTPPRSNTAVLNPRYTFKDFVVGDGNQFAYAAATAVAQHPGTQYNPLFIYSGVGLGKTHLLHAISAEVTSHRLHPLYVTSEQFTSDFIRSIRSKSPDDFKGKYRDADVLLIDDIQFLEGKEQTQVGFFHTFNELHTQGKQIIIASDRPPSAVPVLEDRLNSRFEWGLVVDIQPPDLETRAAILHSKAETSNVSLTYEVATWIARLASKSVRELEGYLNKVLALSQFLKRDITLDFVESTLAEFNHRLTQQSDPNTPQGIITSVANYFHITPEELCQRSSDQKTTEQQRIAMYILRTYLRLSPSEIGSSTGNWSRRTVSTAVRSIETRLVEDREFKTQFDRIITSL